MQTLIPRVSLNCLKATQYSTLLCMTVFHRAFFRYLWMLCLTALLCSSAFASEKSDFGSSHAFKEYTTIEWVDLIPKADLDILLNPPVSITSIPHGAPTGSLDDGLDSLTDSISDSIEQAMSNIDKIPTPEEQAYSAALSSTNINQGFDQKKVRIPGFIVPVEYTNDLVITSFFLVPYFGACIHVPPPPPNQIIYVDYPPGLSLNALYDPFWIEGVMQTDLIENDIATSAYTVTAQQVKPYEEYSK